jgi:hypothetical protein
VALPFCKLCNRLVFGPVHPILHWILSQGSGSREGDRAEEGSVNCMFYIVILFVLGFFPPIPGITKIGTNSQQPWILRINSNIVTIGGGLFLEEIRF